MKAHIWIVFGVVIFVAGCATRVVPEATGGSRADGVVNLSYQYGAFDLPKINQAQARATAAARCAAWGYSNAEPFGGQKSECVENGLYGECVFYQATVAYQCTGAGPR